MYPLYGLDGFPKNCQNNSWPTLYSSLGFVPNSKDRIFFMTLYGVVFLMHYNYKAIFVHKQVSLVPNVNLLIAI